MAEPLGTVGQPMPFRLLLDEAARMMRRHFRSLYPAIALPLGLAYLGLGVFNVYWVRSVASIDESADPFAMFGMCGGLAVLILIMVLLQALATGVVGALAVDIAAGRPARVGARWGFVFRPAVLLSLLALGLLVGVGMMCCLVPGLAAAMYFGLLVPVMAEEGLTLRSAFRRSGDLASYNPTRRLAASPMVKVLVLLFVGYVLSQAISFLVQMPFALAQQVMMFRELAAGNAPEEAMLHSRWQWLGVPGVVLGGLAQAAVLVYVGLGMALLYFDVRGRREGADLEAALDALLAGTGPAGTVAAPEGSAG
jgi:hypothetical protein